MINFTKEKLGLKINIKVISMGKDLNVIITGGDRPHIGAVALAVPVNNSQPIVSHLLVKSHKEDQIVISAAKKLALNLNTSIIVACGIHKDDINRDEIKIFLEMVESGIQEIIDLIRKDVITNKNL